MAHAFDNNVTEAQVPKNVKCFIKCTMLKLKRFANGAFVKERSVAAAAVEPMLAGHMEEIIKAIDKCNKLAAGSDDCERAFNIMKCIKIELHTPIFQFLTLV